MAWANNVYPDQTVPKEYFDLDHLVGIFYTHYQAVKMGLFKFMGKYG